jgi:hypothetical protein
VTGDSGKKRMRKKKGKGEKRGNQDSFCGGGEVLLKQGRGWSV